MQTPPIMIDLPEELVGPRVVVRPWRSGEGAALFEAVEESRQHILPWMPWGPTHGAVEQSEAIVRRMRVRWELREDMPVAFWEKDSGKFLGGSGLHRIDWDLRAFEIGYWVRASEEGKGYVSETVRLLTDMAFRALNANRVFIRCAADNARSAAIPPRLGFVHEGTHRNALLDAVGGIHDLFVFGMTPEDFRAATWSG